METPHKGLPQRDSRERERERKKGSLNPHHQHSSADVTQESSIFYRSTVNLGKLVVTSQSPLWQSFN